MKTRFLVLWNAGAGSATKSDAARERIESDPAADLFDFRDEAEAAARIRDALGRGVERIVAAGGDGTVGTVASLVAQQQAEHTDFAVLPLGTGNDLARTLDMPLDPEAAWDVCRSGQSRPMDLLRVQFGADQTGWAANMVTAGNTGKYTSVITPEMKQKWGPFCYLRGTLDLLQDLDVYELDVKCDDDEAATRYTTLNVFLANGRTSGGGLTVAPDARIDDGLLDLIIVQDGDALDLAALTADYLLSDFRTNPLVQHRRCRQVEFFAIPPVPISIDGDPQPGGKVTVEVEPGAIRTVRGTAVPLDRWTG
jgi:diacylglycerol kinase (ATP)